MSSKKAYEKKTQAQLDDCNNHIVKLKEQATRIQTSAQADYEKQLTELFHLKTLIREKVAELKSASEDSWEDLRKDIDQSLLFLGKAVKSAISRFSED